MSREGVFGGPSADKNSREPLDVVGVSSPRDRCHAGRSHIELLEDAKIAVFWSRLMPSRSGSAHRFGIQGRTAAVPCREVEWTIETATSTSRSSS